MRELLIGEKEIRVRATAPALFYYKREFKSDLISDLIKVFSGTFSFISAVTGKKVSEITEEDLEALKNGEMEIDALDSFEFDNVLLLQIVWAMAKTEQRGQNFPSFEKWLDEEIDPSCVFDPSFLAAAMEEAASGFLYRASEQDKRKLRCAGKN